jgi:hypothetical protein
MKNVTFEKKRIRAKDMFYRNNPITFIFFVMIILLVLGLMFTFLSIFVWITSIVLAVYVIYFIVWLLLNKWW